MTTRRALLTQLGLLGAAGAGAWWLKREVVFPAPHASFAGPDGSGWLDFALPEPLTAVEARLSGLRAIPGGVHPVGALIDSGAQTSVLDARTAERLGVRPGAPLPLLAYGVSGRPQVGRAARLDVALGGLVLPGLRVALLDLGPIVEATGGAATLVLGQDVLRQAVLDVDFPGRRLALRPPGFALVPEGGAPAAARLASGELMTAVKVEGAAPAWAVVDTGSSAALALSERAAAAAGLLDGRAATWSAGVTFGGASRSRTVRAARVAFGHVSLEDVAVQIYAGGAAGALPDGLLGAGALDRLQVRLDLARGALGLAPPPGDASAAPRRHGRAVAVGVSAPP